MQNDGTMGYSIPTELKYVNGKFGRSAMPYAGAVPANCPSSVRKRMAQFNTWSPGYNYGLPLGNYYEALMNGQLNLLPDGKMAITDPMTMTKDSPITTADTGAHNYIYGATAVIQYAQNANAYNAIGKSVWPSSGFRVNYTAAVSSGIGVAQSSDRPATIEPTYLEVSVLPKEIAIATELSDVLVILGETDDAVTFSVNKEQVESNVMNSWDTDMLVDGNTLAGNNFESLDRVTASSTTSSNLGWTTADEDLHGLDRSSYTWFNAQSYDASGSDRYLTRSHLDTALYAALPYFSNPSERSSAFWLTGYTTMPSWESLEEAKQFLTTGYSQIDVNGVKTQPGLEGGVSLMRYKGIPIIQDNNVVADTLERIYLLNSEYVKMVMGRPLEFLTSDNPFNVGFNKMGLWHAIGELWCVKPAATASIRDLK